MRWNKRGLLSSRYAPVIPTFIYWFIGYRSHICK
jgi:hypothetical protein